VSQGDDGPLGIPGHVTGDAEHSRFVAACTHAHPLHRQGAPVTETVTENVPLGHFRAVNQLHIA
jgi:hypothetical protein